MAITRIRGGQIHDHTIDGIKIQLGALLNEHFASNAAIHESKLDINWESHTEILQNKKIVDYVQVNKTDVSGVSSIDVTALSIIPNTDEAVLSDPLSGEGIIVDEPKNRIILRDSITGDPVLDQHGHEVFGRIKKDEAENKFIVHFYTNENDVETPFTMPEGQKIDWQYARRFNLLTINEMFAANEKFVEGAADATAHLNIEQLAKDLYGSVFSLDRDGNGNLEKSVALQISEEIIRAKQAEFDLQTNIDGEAAARIAADNSIINDLSSTSTGKGSSLVGFSNSEFTAKTVEEAIIELGTRVTGVEGGGSETGTEVVNARSSTVKSADGGTTPKVFNSLDARLEEIEQDAVNNNTRVKAIEDKNTEQDTRLDTVENEIEETYTRDTESVNKYFPIQTFTSLEERLNNIETLTDAGLKQSATSNSEVMDARGTAATLDERLSASLNEDGTLKIGKQVHSHKKTILQISSTASIVDMPVGQTFVNDGTLNVYINGILQANGINFTEVLDVDGKGISIDFGAEQVVAGDIVVLEWVVYNGQ